jgi:hypothetical protein
MNDDVYNALCGSHPEDIHKIRKYIAWVKMRRKIHHVFFFRAHWLGPERKYHWLGR